MEYSFDASPVLNVPGDWNTQREPLMFYEGTVWYRREFNYHKHASTRVVRLLRRSQLSGVGLLERREAGEHEGGFTAFNFEVTSLLREGENSLVVEVK